MAPPPPRPAPPPTPQASVSNIVTAQALFSPMFAMGQHKGGAVIGSPFHRFPQVAVTGNVGVPSPSRRPPCRRLRCTPRPRWRLRP